MSIKICDAHLADRVNGINGDVVTYHRNCPSCIEEALDKAWRFDRITAALSASTLKEEKEGEEYFIKYAMDTLIGYAFELGKVVLGTPESGPRH